MRIRLVFVAAVLAGAGWADAQLAPQDISRPDLESAYWHCIDLDARSTADGQRLDESLLSDCAAISKRLQIDRFGDDFGKLHEWTKAHMAAQGSRNVPVGTIRHTD